MKKWWKNKNAKKWINFGDGKFVANKIAIPLLMKQQERVAYKIEKIIFKQLSTSSFRNHFLNWSLLANDYKTLEFKNFVAQ